MSKFKKGESGNPSGRPRGIKDRRMLFLSMLDEYHEPLLTKAFQMAAVGNEVMLKLLLDRLLPAKPRDEIVEIDMAGSLQERVNNVIVSLGEGKLTPTETNTLLSALSKQADLVEIVDIRERLDVLEEKSRKNSNPKHLSNV